MGDYLIICRLTQFYVVTKYTSKRIKNEKFRIIFSGLARNKVQFYILYIIIFAHNFNSMKASSRFHSISRKYLKFKRILE